MFNPHIVIHCMAWKPQHTWHSHGCENEKLCCHFFEIWKFSTTSGLVKISIKNHDRTSTSAKTLLFSLGSDVLFLYQKNLDAFATDDGGVEWEYERVKWIFHENKIFLCLRRTLRKIVVIFSHRKLQLNCFLSVFESSAIFSISYSIFSGEGGKVERVS